MAHQRAPIAVHALEDARVDLTPVRERRSPVEPPIDDLPAPGTQVRKFMANPLPASFPSVAKASAKDRLVSFSVRLRSSQVDQLEQLKKDHEIVPSELLRDFVDRCLPDVLKALKK